jgi:hypothetical protein
MGRSPRRQVSRVIASSSRRFLSGKRRHLYFPFDWTKRHRQVFQKETRQLSKQMNPSHFAALFAGSLFLGMLILLAIGRRIGARRLAADPDGARTRLGAVEGALFGLLGLLIAFTFSGAAARFDSRRQLVVDEANCIGTAYRRIALLPDAVQEPLRDLFRQYLDSRLETYRKLPDLAAATTEWQHSLQLQDVIWTNAVAACHAAATAPPTMLLLPSLNQTFDIANTRIVATKRHPPATIYIMLAGLALAAALLAGHGLAGAKVPSRVHAIGFAAIVALTAYVTLDLEFPRFGLIRLDAADQVLVEVRESMK